MKNKKIPLYDVKVSSEAISNVTDSLKSGWLSSGPKTIAFEKAMAKLWKSKHTVAVSSATTGLTLALLAISLKPGDEVITTPLTFVATIEAIILAGGKPVLADIDPNSFNIDPGDVEKKITKKTKAVIPIDLGGYPADYAALGKLCRKYKLKLIADAAHSVASTYKNKSVVHHCEATVLSFHVTKNLFCGEGGMVLTNKKQIADKVRLLSRHGLSSIAYDRKKTGGWEYDAHLMGIKGNMSELHAAVGLGQLTAFSKHQKQRTKLAKRYYEKLSLLNDYLSLPKISDDTGHGWHLFILKLNLRKLKIDRNRFINLMGKNSIECGVHYKPICRLSYYRKILAKKPNSFPVTEKTWPALVTLPLYPSLKLKEVDQICSVIEEIILKNKK